MRVESMYGRTHEEWEEMRDAAASFLVSVAKNQMMTDYSTLNREIVEQTGHRPFNFSRDADRAAIGHLLGEISVASNDEHGVMLSALVTHRGSNNEGAGFYKLAAKLGKMPGKPTSDEKTQAFVRLTRQVHDFYTTH